MTDPSPEERNAVGLVTTIAAIHKKAGETYDTVVCHHALGKLLDLLRDHPELGIWCARSRERAAAAEV